MTFNTGSYQIRIDTYSELKRYCDNVPKTIDSIVRDYKESVQDLDSQKISASKIEGFHEDSYDQDYQFDLDQIKLGCIDKLVSLHNDLFSRFETSLREIAIYATSSEKVKYHKHKSSSKSNIQVYKEVIVSEKNIISNSLETLWIDIDAFRQDRCKYEHEGYDMKKSANELKKEILDMNDKIFKYLDELMKLL